MTVTDNGVDVDPALLARARELATDGLPSKRRLQRHLNRGWDAVNAVYTRLEAEAAASAAEQRRRARSTIRRLPGRKHRGAGRVTVRPCFQIVNEMPPAATVEPAAEPVRIAVREAAQEDLAPAPLAASRTVATWPIFLLALPAFVAIWSGWVDLGRLTGFGVVHPLPGIWDEAQLDTAITLPVGLETYAAYALYVWLSGAVPAAARRWAKWSAIGSLTLGAAGQVAYHLMIAAHMRQAPWQITTVVACLPVAVLGMGAALRHLVHTDDRQP